MWKRADMYFNAVLSHQFAKAPGCFQVHHAAGPQPGETLRAAALSAVHRAQHPFR